jgi:hypothetical protein
MTKRRKLTDLYRREAVVTIDDGQGDPVKVLVRKMSPVDYERAYRKANALRATILTLNNEESDYYQSTKNEIVEMSRDALIDYLANAGTAKELPVIEGEVAGGDKWNKDEYIVGLMDAWEGGLKDAYAEDPEDAEAKAVFEKMKEYQEEVEAAITDYSESLKDSYSKLSDVELQDIATKDMLKLNADMAWMNEFRRWEIFLSSYDPDTKNRIFSERAEIDDLSPEVLNVLSVKIEELVVELTEGKDLSQPVSS